MLRTRLRDRGSGSGGGSSLIDGNDGVVVLFGDSLEQHSLYQSTTAGSEELSNWSRGYINWNRTIDPRGIWVNWYDATVTQRNAEGTNQGISGNNTSQMLARTADVTNIPGVGVVVVGGGTNDISTDTTSGNAAARYALATSNLSAIYAAFKAAGYKIIIMSIPPRPVTESNSWASGSAARQLWFDICAWMQAQADADPSNIKIVRRDLICSNADADRTPKTGYIQADNVHITPIGGYHIAADTGGLNEKLATLMTSYTSFPSAVMSGDLCTNPTLSGTGGTVTAPCTGVAPDNMRLRRLTGTAITAVGSKETINGEEYYKIVVTRDGSTATVESISVDLGANISSGLPATGDWLQPAIKAKWNASSAIQQVSIQARQQPSSPANMNNYSLRFDSGYLWENTNIAATDGSGLWQISCPFAMRASATSIIYNALISVDNSTAGTETVWISRMHLYPITDPRPPIFPEIFLQEEDSTLLLTEDSDYLEIE